MKTIFILTLSLASFKNIVINEQLIEEEYHVLQEKELKIVAKFIGYDDFSEAYEFSYEDADNIHPVIRFNEVPQDLVNKFSLQSDVNTDKVFEISYTEEVLKQGNEEVKVLKIVSLVLK